MAFAISIAGADVIGVAVPNVVAVENEHEIAAVNEVAAVGFCGSVCEVDNKAVPVVTEDEDTSDAKSCSL